MMTRHARQLWPLERVSELIEARQAVERMLSDPGWEAVKAVLDEEIATIDRELDDGPPKEQAEYAHKHGRRSAIRAAEEAARGIIGYAVTQQEKAEEAQRETDARRDGASERQAA